MLLICMMLKLTLVKDNMVKVMLVLLPTMVLDYESPVFAGYIDLLYGCNTCL